MAKKKSAADRFMDAADSASKAGDVLSEQRLSGNYSLTGRDARRFVKDIKPRPGGNTRELDPVHIMELAESISALGLLQPIAIDKNNCLVAGEHRLEACRLLTLDDPKARVAHWDQILMDTSKKPKDVLGLLPSIKKLKPEAFKEHYKDETIPVLVLPFKAEDNLDAALAAETAENEKRQNYTKKEILNLADRLKSAGYVDRAGRPKVGEKSLKKALTVISGKSWRQIYRDLSEEKTLTHDRVFDEEKTLKKLLELASQFSEHASAESAYLQIVNDFIAKVNAVDLEKAVTDQ